MFRRPDVACLSRSVAALAAVCIVAASAAMPRIALAQQDFPSKPITILVPWPAGGSTDQAMRAFAEAAGRHLKTTILVENRPGAGGTIGPIHLAQTAKPDGYTLSQMPMGMFRLPHMQKLAVDPIKDFTYVINLTGYTFGVVVRADSPIKTFRELIDFAKKNPGKLNYGSTGTGTSPHLLMEIVAQREGLDLLHVPYKGNAELTTALLGGHIMAQSDATGWATQVDAGRARLLITFGAQRTKRWPTVPTAQELGLGIVSNSPYGIVAPRGLDPKILAILHDGLKKALDDPEHQKALDRFDQETFYMNSGDYEKWARETFVQERALIAKLGLLAK